MEDGHLAPLGESFHRCLAVIMDGPRPHGLYRDTAMPAPTGSESMYDLDSLNMDINPTDLFLSL